MSILDDVKNRKHGASRLGIASALIALGISGISSTARAEDGDRRGLSAPIEGTWIITVDRVSEGVTFTALESFALAVLNWPQERCRPQPHWAAGGVSIKTLTSPHLPSLSSIMQATRSR